jgi:hypothetical protein
MRVAKLANLAHNLTYVFRLIANISTTIVYNAVLDLHATVHKLQDDLII